MLGVVESFLSACKGRLVVALRVLEVVASFLDTWLVLVKKGLLLLVCIQIGSIVKLKRSFFSK